MRFLPLLLANLRRKKIRTVLTIGSFMVALFLFGLLAAVRAGFRQGIDIAGADRLVVIGRTGVIQPLPLPYMERIRRIPGVDGRRARDLVRRRLPGPEELLPAVRDRARASGGGCTPSSRCPTTQWRAFLADRQGVVVGAKLAERFGWKIGDRIPLKAPGLPGRRQLGLQRAGDLPRHAAAGRRGPALDPAQATSTRRRRVLAGDRGLVRRARPAIPTPPWRWPRRSTRSSPTPPRRPARRPSRPSPPRS